VSEDYRVFAAHRGWLFNAASLAAGWMVLGSTATPLIFKIVHWIILKA
jgi:hypothetical protein